MIQIVLQNVVMKKRGYRMEWDDKNIGRMIAYINLELSKGRTMIDIENNEFNVNERVIHKRLIRKGYNKFNFNFL